MKILVIDPNSMVGHVVFQFFKDHNHEVVGYGEKQYGEIFNVSGSLFNLELLKNVIIEGDFDAIINCSAIINDDAENDKSLSSYINAFIPHFLEKITHGTKTIIVHRSTDCIFSGIKGQYSLDDIPDGQSFYARTKAIGEINNKKDITIRTSLIGPEIDANGNSLFNWFYNQKGEVKGFANSIWTGLTTIEFAREIEILLGLKAHGVFQLVPDYAIGKYDLLVLFEKYFPKCRNIIRIENERVDKSLLPEKNGYKLVIPEYDNMIREMWDWINKHSDIYNYNL